MQANEFEQLVASVEQMNHRQRRVLMAALENLSDESKTIEVIETRFEAEGACPHCGERHLHKHASANGLQRYRCTACGKTFNALTGTPLARLRHKDKWFAYLKALAQSLTVRQSATEAAIHRNTAFRWRHRFLNWLKDDQPKALHGITEADETYFLDSHKGSRTLPRQARKRGGSARKRGLSKEQVCVLSARDRVGQTMDAPTGYGPLTKDQLTLHLKPKLAEDVLLVSDANASYHYFSRQQGISHQAVNLSRGQRVLDGAYHVQNVNAYHSRLKRWMDRFHGVATKYLGNYLGWRRTLEKHARLSPELLLNASLGKFQQLTVT